MPIAFSVEKRNGNQTENYEKNIFLKGDVGVVGNLYLVCVIAKHANKKATVKTALNNTAKQK